MNNEKSKNVIYTSKALHKLTKEAVNQNREYIHLFPKDNKYEEGKLQSEYKNYDSLKVGSIYIKLLYRK